MRKFFYLLLLFSSTQIFSQAPQGINYQAVARDVSGNPLATQSITATFRIRQTIPTGTAVYRGTLNTTTNQFGLFTAIIGQTGLDSGSFSTISWGTDNFYLQVIINSYDMGTTQFMSVPYSFYSSQSGSTISSVPVGTIVAYGGTTAPTGWLLCDGSQVSRTTYANLFSAIGTAYGYGNNSTTFHLPDLRGRFLRGTDGTANNDPDKATRTTSNIGGNTGNNIGSLQVDNFFSHSHGLNARSFAGGWYGNSDATTTSIIGSRVQGTASSGYIWWNGSSDVVNTTSIQSSGGNETRPKNVYVNYIIKY